MEKENYDLLFKIIIIGNTSTGKTCLLNFFDSGKFKKNVTYTIGVEFGSKIVTLGQKNIKLQMWDTAGQERFRSVARTYYRGALGALIVYDITNLDTFRALDQWIKDARELGRSDIQILICGNKCDLKDSRVVSYTEACKFCKENNASYIETSALVGENVQDAFLLITKNINEQVERGIINKEDLKPKILYSSGRNNKQLENDQEQKNKLANCSC